MAGGKSKYSSEIKTKAMTLWAEGLSVREVAEKLGIKSFRTVQNWKKDNYPDNWRKYKENLLKKSVDKIEKEQLESMTSVKIRQQKQLRAVAGSSGALLTKRANEGTLDSETAWTAFREATEMEQKLYMEPSELFGSKRTMGMASKMNTSTGESVMAGWMEEIYEESREKK